MIIKKCSSPDISYASIYITQHKSNIYAGVKMLSTTNIYENISYRYRNNWKYCYMSTKANIMELIDSLNKLIIL